MDKSMIPPLELKTIEEIKRISAKQAVHIKIQPEKTPKITDSKFGGVPYWDLCMEYPTRSDGTLLMLLAQINLDELNREGKNPGGKLPKSGMLQFFVDCMDDIIGMDDQNTFDDNGKLPQDGFRIVYHKNINEAVSEADVKALGIPLSTDEELENTPIWGEYGLDIELEEQYIGTADYQFQKYFHKAAESVGWTIDPEKGFYQNFSAASREYLDEELNNPGHWMLGYPYFIQCDPRSDFERNAYQKDYNFQLFQMDSDYGNDTDYILWGDCGVANFFINADDLAKEDFSDVLYSWDCC